MSLLLVSLNICLQYFSDLGDLIESNAHADYNSGHQSQQEDH